MLNFLITYWATLLVAAVLLGIVVLAAAKLIKDKKNHKSSCGCGCAGCPSAGLCHPEPARAIPPST